MKIKDYPNKEKLDPTDLFVIQEEDGGTKKIKGSSTLDLIYPIGSIYLSVLNTNPSLLFGGEWQLLAPGKTLVCIDQEDPDFFQGRKTGGEKTHTLSVEETPSHVHGVGAHTHGLNNHTHSFVTGNPSNNHSHAIPALGGSTNVSGLHRHYLDQKRTYSFVGLNGSISAYKGAYPAQDLTGNGINYLYINGGLSTPSHTETTGSHDHTVTTHDNVTGGVSEWHTHGGTTDGSNENTANNTPFNTAAAGSGNAHNNLQPYFVCYMWERVA